MQYVKPNIFLQFFLVPFFIVAGIFLAAFKPQVFLPIFYTHWVFVLLCAAILFSPWGSVRLGTSDTQTSFWTWMGSIMLLELSLLAIFYGMTKISSSLILILTPERPDVFNMTLAMLFKSWGLFPWGLVAILTCLYGLVAYACRREAWMSENFFSLFRKSSNEPLSVVFNISAKISVIFLLSTILLFSVLEIGWLFSEFQIGEILTGFNLPSLLIAVAFLAVFHIKKLGERLFNFFIKKNFSIFTMMFIFVVSLAFFWVFFSTLFYSSHPLAVNLPSLLHPEQWIAEWALLAGSWWMYSAVLTSLVIAYYSRGRTLRHIILGIFALPLFIFLGVNSPPISVNLSGKGSVLIGLMGTVIFLKLVLRKNMVPLLMYAYLPTDHVRHQGPRRFIFNLPRYTLIWTYVFLPAGVLGLNLGLSILLITYIGIMLLIPAAFLKEIIESRKHPKVS